MKFNVTLDKEQMDEIASITADKVLATVKYQKNNEDWCDREIKELKLAVSERDSMLVQKDLIIERLRELLKKTRTELKELKTE
jgi:DNA polymerase sigma